MHLKQRHRWRHHRWAAFWVWQRRAWRGDGKWYLGPKLESWDERLGVENSIFPGASSWRK